MCRVFRSGEKASRCAIGKRTSEGPVLFWSCTISIRKLRGPPAFSERSDCLHQRKLAMHTKYKFVIAAASAVALMFSAAAFAQQGGTAQEARAMLDKAVAAVKADEAVALAMFTKGEGGFKDRDLYPFCFRVSDGKNVAGLQIAVKAGTDVRTLKDSNGNPFGLEVWAAGHKPEGQITEINIMFPKPGTTTPAVPKTVFIEHVADLFCGVGYYK
jgi:hypothetical protein